MKPQPGEGRGNTTKNCEELNSGILGLGFWSFYFWGFQLGFPVDNFFFLVGFRTVGSSGPFFPKKKKKRPSKMKILNSRELLSCFCFFPQSGIPINPRKKNISLGHYFYFYFTKYTCKEIL